MSRIVRTLVSIQLALGTSEKLCTERAALDRLFGPGPAETFTIHSETLARDFHVYVRVPQDYAGSDCDWPVVCMLDGGCGGAEQSLRSSGCRGAMKSSSCRSGG